MHVEFSGCFIRRATSLGATLFYLGTLIWVMPAAAARLDIPDISPKGGVFTSNVTVSLTAGGKEVRETLAPEVALDRLRDTLSTPAAKLAQALAAAEQKRANEGFVRGADPEIVAQERERAEQGKVELELLRRNLAGL